MPTGSGQFCVYAIYRKDDGKDFYIGQTDNPARRKREHINDTLAKRDLTWETHEMLVLHRFETRQEALDCERNLIEQFQPDWNIAGNPSAQKTTS